MMTEGASAIAVAPQPLDPDPLWAAVVTGKTSRDGERSVPGLTAADLTAPPIWRLLEEAGVPSGVFNLKLTTRPEAVTGFMFARDARPLIRQDLVHPPSLYPRLREQFGVWTTTSTARTKEEWTSVVLREMETRTDVLAELLRTRPWKFALAQLPEVSRAQHRFWQEPDSVRSIYVAADRAIGRLMDVAGPEATVFVFSECGAGPIRHGVQLNTWLEQEGYLRRRERLLSKIVFSAVRAYRSGIRRLLPGAFDRSSLKVRARAAIEGSGIDWQHTRAFSPRASGKIVFNVPQQQHEARDIELRSRLRSLRDPQGCRVVEEVIPLKDGGLSIVWEDDAYVPVDDFESRDQVFVAWRPELPDWTFTGTHRREGILLASGPGIPRTNLGRLKTVDLVPTWLDLLDVAKPKELEGTSFARKLIAAEPGAFLRIEGHPGSLP
jgi:predicted AlkP superfamily phosphohydrolase/phosphomutase